MFRNIDFTACKVGHQKLIQPGGKCTNSSNLTRRNVQGNGKCMVHVSR
jgi:hypothetical protein